MFVEFSDEALGFQGPWDSLWAISRPLEQKPLGAQVLQKAHNYNNDYCSASRPTAQQMKEASIG
jgi:hypothetical protein